MISRQSTIEAISLDSSTAKTNECSNGLPEEACKTFVFARGSCAVDAVFVSARLQPRRSSLKAPVTRLLYPRKDAAFQLGISLRSLDYLIANQKIRFQKIGSRVLIHHKELERFASANHYGTVVA